MKLANFSVVISILLFSASAFPQGAKTPLPDDVALYFKGRTFTSTSSTPRGIITVEVTQNESGSIEISAGPRGPDSGEWSYDAGRHCVKWKYKYDNSCGTLTKDADGSIKRVREGAGDTSTWRLK